MSAWPSSEALVAVVGHVERHEFEPGLEARELVTDVRAQLGLIRAAAEAWVGNGVSPDRRWLRFLESLGAARAKAVNTT